MTPIETILLILTGIFAGFLNVIAAGGSMIVVPLLIFFGLPASEANATNRVTIFMQNLVAVFTFKQKKVLDTKTNYSLLIPVGIGSMAGAFFAVDIQEDVLEKIIGGMLIVMFFMVLLKPESWIKANTEKAKAKRPIIRFLIFVAIGFYGGFIQMGAGFFILAALVLGSGFDLLKANILKVFIILFFTTIALTIFIWHNLIDWQVGLTLSCGGVIGAYIGSLVSVKMSPKYIRYFLLVALTVVTLKLFNAF